jgi:hypothetical protein
MGTLKHTNAGALCIAYEESGNVDGIPLYFLTDLHTTRAYDEVTKHLLTENRRIIVLYLRGFGPTNEAEVIRNSFH